MWCCKQENDGYENIGSFGLGSTCLWNNFRKSLENGICQNEQNSWHLLWKFCRLLFPSWAFASFSGQTLLKNFGPKKTRAAGECLRRENVQGFEKCKNTNLVLSDHTSFMPHSGPGYLKMIPVCLAFRKLEWKLVTLRLSPHSFNLCFIFVFSSQSFKTSAFSPPAFLQEAVFWNFI